MVRVRACLSLGVLVLFPVVVLAALGGALALAVWVGSASGVAGVKVAGWLAVPLLAAVWYAVREAVRSRPQPSRAPELLRSDHPQLWAEVDALAAGLRTAPPERIVVEPLVNASVTEAGGHREMAIGLPLLVGMSRPQLRAVLAHELGHYGGGHTRLAAMSYRARDAVLGTVRNLDGGPARWIVGGYARLYLVVAAWANRSQEREADAYAARVAGPATAASALRRVLAIDAAWDALVEDYLPLAGVAERRPQLGTGLAHLLDSRGRAIDDAVGRYLAGGGGRTSAYDSHPPMNERIARLSSSAAPESEADTDEPAWVLLGDGARTLDELESQLLTDGLPADWDDVTAIAGARLAAATAGDLARAAEQSGVRPPVTLAALLDAVERGEGARVVAPLVNPGVHPDHRAEADRAVLTTHLTGAVTHALCEVGAAVHRLNWAGPWTLRSTAAPDEVLDVEPLVAAVVAEPGRMPALRAWLAERGVSTETSVESAPEPEPAMLAAVTHVLAGEGRKRFDLVVCDTGLLLVPAQARSRWAGGLQALVGQQRRAEGERLEERADLGVAALRQEDDARWIDTDDIVAGRIAPRPWGWSLYLRLSDASELHVRSTTDTNDHGTPLDAINSLLGARAGKEAWKGAPA